MTDLVARLRAVGSVFAEDEAAQIVAAGVDPDVAVSQRGRGVPLEQVLGRMTFAGVELALGPDVFVPRHRAVVLIDALDDVAASVIVDLGTGVGAIAAALAVRHPAAEIHGVDVDRAALAWARHNAGAYGFTVHEGEWWDPLPTSLAGRVDLAVAYLPHVPTSHLGDVHPDFRAHEPTRAVDGGADGLTPLRAVLQGLADWLAPGGAFVTLVSRDQVDAVRRLAATHDVAADLVTEGDGDAVVRLSRVSAFRE